MSERDKYPSEVAERFQIRLPDGLRDRIKEAADRNGRSMNSEIVSVLEREYPAPRATLEDVLLFYEDLVKIADTRNPKEHAAVLEMLREDIADGRLDPKTPVQANLIRSFRNRAHWKLSIGPAEGATPKPPADDAREDDE